MGILKALFDRTPVRETSVAEVDRLLNAGHAFAYDANPASRYRSGHLPHARNIDPADYSLEDLPPDKDAVLVFYCKDPGCGAAAFAARKALRRLQTGLPHGGWN